MHINGWRLVVCGQAGIIGALRFEPIFP